MALPTVVVAGYLARDPEMRYTPNGTAVTNFSIAINRKDRGQNGEEVEVRDWYNSPLSAGWASL